MWATTATVLLPFTQAKQALDRLKRLCIGRDLPDAGACARFDKTTKHGKDMSAVQELLAKAVASIVGKKEERAVASLFTPGRHPCHERRISWHQRLRGRGLPRGTPGERRSGIAIGPYSLWSGGKFVSEFVARLSGSQKRSTRLTRM